MRLIYDIEPVDMGDEIIAVPVGENAKELSAVLKLNKTGAEILQLLNEGKNADIISSVLSTKYDNDTDIKKSVDEFIDELLELGVVTK